MPSLAAKTSSTALSDATTTMATINDNNSIHVATTATTSMSSSSTVLSNVNASGSTTASANDISSANAIQQQQQQQEDYLKPPPLQQQQHHNYHHHQQQSHSQHYQKYNYYYPPPAVGNALHYKNSSSSGSGSGSNNAIENVNTSVTVATTTSLTTFNGNSNLENLPTSSSSSSSINNNNNNSNHFTLNYSNGNSSATTTATATATATANANSIKLNSLNSSMPSPTTAAGNSITGHKTDTISTGGGGGGGGGSCSNSILSGGSIVGIAPTSAFKKQQQQQQQQQHYHHQQQQQQLHTSREDVTSLGGSSSLNSQISTNANANSISNNNNNNNNSNVNATAVNGVSNSNNHHNPSSILKGSKENLLQNNYCNGSVGGGSTTGSEGIGPVSLNLPEHDDPGDGLGPLPPKWETAYTERGELYFIDHNTGTSHWLDPRLSKYQKKSLEECSEDELPYGWEKIEDSLYGTYYIDHVNRKTQYENPVLEAKRRAAEQRQQQHHQQQQHQNQLPPPPPIQRPQTPSSSSVLNGTTASIALSSVSSASTLSTVDISQRAMQSPPPVMAQEQNANKPALLPYKFTRNPNEMQGERITATLLKSARGLGITIVGGDDGVEEFLQIKSIVPNGPAWLDGQLQMGDVLVYVNDTCVLGFTHHEMVNVFQSIMPGETVTLEVCRGYPLPFDPNDPNTEVVTTIAVDGLSAHEPDKQRRMLMELNMDGNYNFLDMSSSGANSNGVQQIKNNLNTINAIDNSGFILMKKPEVHTLSIIKGAMGFGFTIADSSYGQKVKKILDRNCCNQLQEGDILLEINDMVVRNKSHADVVQILKDCSKTETTLVKIQRPVTSSSSLSANNNSSTSTNSSGGQTTAGQTTGGGSNTVAKLRKNFLGATTAGLGNNALFRSKTPTADLYSTMQKEILPIRPKTPLVDTRRARVNTPNIELNEDREVAAVNTSAEESALERSLAESKSHLNEGNKSQNSLTEIDAIHQDIPFMDPYPKMVTSLSERLAGVSMTNDHPLGHSNGMLPGGYLRTTASGVPNYENHGDYVSAASSGNYSSIYGLAQMPPVMSPLSGGLYGPPGSAAAANAATLPSSSTTSGLMAPATAAVYHHHHHESCFCYDCQDFRNNRLRNAANAAHTLQPPMQHHQQQQQLQQQQPSPRSYYPMYQHGHSQYSPASSASLQAAHIQNERMQKRVNEFLNERRRVGFSPLDQHQHNSAAGGGYSPSQQQQQQQHSHQHPMHNLANQQQQHSPAHHTQFTNNQWGLNNNNNNGLNYNTLQPSGDLIRNGYPEPSADILDGSGEQFILSEVTLQRQALGFGFRIVGGTEEGSQVTVGHIVPGGAADNDHRITTGDEILSIDGINVVNSSHHKVVSLMGEAALRGQVTMILRRRARIGLIQQQTHNIPPLVQHPSPLQTMLLNNPAPIRYPYDVIVTRHENEGFGFVIISSSNQYYGSTIGKLIPGSPADRCGELKVGDRIIAVNRIDIAGMSHGDVVNLIKESGLHVRLTIGCPKEGAIINAAPTMPAGSGNSGNSNLLLNSSQASPGQISQNLTPTLLQTNTDATTAYFERPLIGPGAGGGGSNTGSITSSAASHNQLTLQQQSPQPLPAPPPQL